VLGTVHTHGRVLFLWWWWPVGPKLVFGQMEAPLLEIMETSGSSAWNYSSLELEVQVLLTALVLISV
jgi:hypothetical protein